MQLDVLKTLKVTIDELAKVAANARSEVQKLLTILEGPVVTDIQQKYEDRLYDVDSDSCIYIPKFKAPEERNDIYQGTSYIGYQAAE